MPTTALGLIVFVAFLVPGFISYSQRRQLTITPKVSPLMETASIVTISLVTNLAALSLLVVARLLWGEEVAPDVRAMIGDGWIYTNRHLPKVFAWSLGLLTISCGLAFVSARPNRVSNRIRSWIAPVITNDPAWYHVFESGPPDTYIYVTCLVSDGVRIEGFLDWYSTEPDETSDRDLVLAEPITITNARGVPCRSDASRLVLSAREIRRLEVEWPLDEPIEAVDEADDRG